MRPGAGFGLGLAAAISLLPGLAPPARAGADRVEPDPAVLARPGLEPRVREGRALYERGSTLGVSAEGLGAEAGGEASRLAAESFGVPLAGGAAACHNCHREPRRGGGESGIVAPPLAWSRLQLPSAGRPGYDAASFARALRDGLDPAGRPLHALMPRYRLDEAGLAALLAWLRSPAAAAAAGVEPRRLRLAAVLPVDGPLRRAGLAAAASLQASAQAYNEGGGAYGRRVEIETWDRRDGDAALRERLAASPPLAVIGSVGLEAGDALALELRSLGVPELAPLASGIEDDPLQRLLRPGLLHQAQALVQRALAEGGCLDLDTGRDPGSAAVAARLERDVQAQPASRRPTLRRLSPPTAGRACPRRLVLAAGDEAAPRFERAARDGVRELYFSGEQAGWPTQAPRARWVIATGGEGSLERQARANAQRAWPMLQEALAAAGRELDAPALLRHWPVDDAALRRQVLLRVVDVPERSDPAAPSAGPLPGR